MSDFPTEQELDDLEGNDTVVPNWDDLGVPIDDDDEPDDLDAHDDAPPEDLEAAEDET